MARKRLTLIAVCMASGAQGRPSDCNWHSMCCWECAIHIGHCCLCRFDIDHLFEKTFSGCTVLNATFLSSFAHSRAEYCWLLFACRTWVANMDYSLPWFCYNFIATLLWVLHCCYWNAITCLCSKTVQIHRISRSSCKHCILKYSTYVCFSSCLWILYS